MIQYINIKSDDGVETIDELNSKDFKTLKEFNKALNQLLVDYKHHADVYTSQRCDKNWNKKIK